MSSTVAAVALEGFREEEAPWKYAGYRCNTACMGRLALKTLSGVLPGGPTHTLRWHTRRWLALVN